MCSAAAAMADGKLQQVRRSISSWSLSTIKKPKITIPKLKTPKVKIFRGTKKNRVDPKDEAAALEEVKAALMKAEEDATVEGAAAVEGRAEGNLEPETEGAEGGEVSTVASVHEQNTQPRPPSPPSPSMLTVRDDIDFIDSDADTDDKVIEAIRADLDYSDQWFDARGTLTRSKENVVEAFNDMDDDQESKFYDIVDNPPLKDEIETVPKENPKGGSQKAREWVKSFDEKAESRIQKWLKMNKTKTLANAPKSTSEIRLDQIHDPPDKWVKRDEIKLNTMSKGAVHSDILQGDNILLPGKEGKKDTEKEKFLSKGNLKKIFKVKGNTYSKTSIDTPKIVQPDNESSMVKDSHTTISSEEATPRNNEQLDISHGSTETLTDALVNAGKEFKPVIEQGKEITTTTSLPPAVIKSITSSDTETSKNTDVSEIPHNSVDVVDKQLMHEIPPSETVKGKASSLKQQEVLDNITSNSTNIASGEQRNSKEVIKYNETSLPKPFENSKDNTPVPIVSNIAENSTSGTEVNGVEVQEPLVSDETNLCSQLDQTTVEACESKTDKEHPPMTAIQKMEDEATESLKVETKEAKKKFSGPNFPKSIRNLAGSVFSQQTSSKNKTDMNVEENENKKRGFFKISMKERVRGKTPPIVKEGEINNESQKENMTNKKNEDVDEDNEKGPITSTLDSMKGSEIPVENAAFPDILPSNESQTINKSQSVSPISMEFMSQVDSVEAKSISLESSKETIFVEENGLRLRKDALLAIKAMEGDNTSTHYYSFLSGSEEFQTPMRYDEDTRPSVPIKPLPTVNLDSSHSDVRNETETIQVHNDETVTGKYREELQENLDQSQSSESCSNVNKENVDETELDNKKVEELNNKNIEEINVKNLTNGSSTNATQQTELLFNGNKTHYLDLPGSENILQSSLERQEPPKPSPRTKKGRYGYSKVGGSVTNGGSSRSTTPSNRDSRTSDYFDNFSDGSPTKATPTYAHTNKSYNAKETTTQTQGTPSKSSQAVPGSNHSNKSDIEPIYWEIIEPIGSPPKPSPRSRKNHKSSCKSSQGINKIDNIITPDTIITNGSQTRPVPDWINTRAPIPSPRGKRQRSLQSLPTVVPTDDNMESVKKKLQLLSQEPLSDASISQRMHPVKKKEEEQFYSGKAASISYGFTATGIIPPSPPLRLRKPSQMSLPDGMAEEEINSRQLKRGSLYGGPEGAVELQPPPPKRIGSSRGRPLQSIGSTVKTEELLGDVLYSVHSLMGGTATGVWKVGGEGELGGPSTRTEVQVEQVVRVLQAALQVTQETIDHLREQVQNRPAPEVSLQLKVKEARELRPKTVGGTANPYVILSVPSSGISHRTRLEKHTLWPKWNQEFTLPVSNFQKEALRVEVWHEHEAVKMKHALTAVRDIKEMSRLVKGTKAQVQHQTSHLLGQVIVNVKELTECGSEGWFLLEKNEERCKERGSIHLEGNVTSRAPLENKSRHSYDALLARLIHHQLTATNNNNEHGEWSRPWDGSLSGPGAAALAQYAIMLDLSDATIQLSWWKVGSNVSTADARWIFSRLQCVQDAMSKNLYTDEELLELRSSFSSFICDHMERLKNLHKAFPPSSGVIAKSQLTFTLRTLQYMQNHGGTRALLDLENLQHLQEMVISSLAAHTKNWWTSVIDGLRDARTTDQQIAVVINIVRESHTFLSIAAATYNAIFMKEMNIPYMQSTYLMVSKKVNPCVRPLVMNIYSKIPTFDEQEGGTDGEGDEYHLEVGTSLWELYMNLGRLHQLGESMSEEARAESGVREYHRWFSRGVLRWLELALHRAQSMIKKAVELDMLEPQDNYCKFSSSASDTLGIFNDVKIWWQKLAWPDPENSAVVLTKILEDICSSVITYSNLIREKVERIFHQQENSVRAFITEQICVGLNNIERVRTEIVKLPTQFGFEEVLQKIRASGSGDGAASQLEATVNRLIMNAAENMESKVTEFIDTVIEKMKPTLERAVEEACEVQSSRPLLAQVLDPTLELTIDQFNNSNFNRFLWHVWEVVVDIFYETVKKNTERRKANYFGGVHSILEATLKFFSPAEGKGLDEKTAMTPAYTSLIELLECLRMTSESLIAKYYQERYEEQMEDILPCKAHLYVKILFTKPGKLIVEVIMAKDMVLEGDTSSITSRGGSLSPYSGHQPVDSYVKVQLVPQEWFPAAAIRKTKTQRKQDPAVYEETFEYDLSKTDDGVRAGFLLLTLKDYNLGFSNTFIGEASVPLSSLPCVDSSQVHTVPNSCFTMTSPGLDIGYKSLRALQFRTADKVAVSFIKKISKRRIEQKPKISTLMRSDEDKARSKSPNLRDRLKLA